MLDRLSRGSVGTDLAPAFVAVDDAAAESLARSSEGGAIVVAFGPPPGGATSPRAITLRLVDADSAPTNRAEARESVSPRDGGTPRPAASPVLVLPRSRWTRVLPSAWRTAVGGTATSPLVREAEVLVRSLLLGASSAVVPAALERIIVDLVTVVVLQEAERRRATGAVPAPSLTAVQDALLAAARAGDGPEAIAARLGVAESRIRFTLEAHGTTIAREWRTARVERLAELLRDEPPDATIAGIAATAGFTDASSATRLFSAHYGMTMSAYRLLVRA